MINVYISLHKQIMTTLIKARPKYHDPIEIRGAFRNVKYWKERKKQSGQNIDTNCCPLVNSALTLILSNLGDRQGSIKNSLIINPSTLIDCQTSFGWHCLSSNPCSPLSDLDCPMINDQFWLFLILSLLERVLTLLSFQVGCCWYNILSPTQPWRFLI